MADEPAFVGKTILELDPHTGAVDRENSYLEIHKVGDAMSVRIKLVDLGAIGLSAKEVVQITHPEVVTDADFITFITGPEGKSAYQVALASGFVGTEAQWLLSLKGTNGTNGTNGNQGIDGKSAYTVAVQEGFVGDVTTWLASLKGIKGDDGDAGMSAYDSAVAGGFVGTETEWIESLQAQLNQASLQALLDQYAWTIKSIIRAKGAQGSFVGNSIWNNFQFLHDARINGEDKDWNLIRPEKDMQKVLESGFLNDVKRGYFKITHAPDTDPDPANPDNTQAEFSIHDDGTFQVGDDQFNVQLQAGSTIVKITIEGVATSYDLSELKPAPGIRPLATAYKGVPTAFFMDGPGENIAWHVSIDWGDGSDVEEVDVPIGSGLGTYLPHTYNQNGQSIATYTATWPGFQSTSRLVVTVSDQVFQVSQKLDVPVPDSTAAPLESQRYSRFLFNGPKTYTFDDSTEAGAYLTDTEFHGRNASSGPLTLVAAGGVVLNAPYGSSLTVPPGGTFTVKFISSSEADVFGVFYAPEDVPVIPIITNWHDNLAVALNQSLTGRTMDGVTWTAGTGFDAALVGEATGSGVSATAAGSGTCGNLATVEALNGSQFVKATFIWERTADEPLYNQLLIKQGNTEIGGIQQAGATIDARFAGSSVSMSEVDISGLMAFKGIIYFDQGTGMATVELYNGLNNGLLLTKMSEVTYDNTQPIDVSLTVFRTSAAKMVVADVDVSGSNVAFTRGGA